MYVAVYCVHVKWTMVFDEELSTAVNDSIYYFDGKYYMDPTCSTELVIIVVRDAESSTESTASIPDGDKAAAAAGYSATDAQAELSLHDAWTSAETKFLVHVM